MKSLEFLKLYIFTSSGSIHLNGRQLCVLLDFIRLVDYKEMFKSTVNLRASRYHSLYACDVVLSVSTPGKLKSLLDRRGNRTRDLWFASPMLYQLCYEVKTVLGDISEHGRITGGGGGEGGVNPPLESL